MVLSLPLVCLCLIALCLPLIAAVSESRVWLVDVVKVPQATNYLFRGDVPVENNVFVIDKLKSFMKQKAQVANVVLPDSYYLIDISFMNIVDQPAAEVNFFQDPVNEQIGEFISWPLGIAGLTHPSDYSNVTQRQEIAQTTAWEFDQIPQRMDQLHAIMHTPGPIGANGLPIPKVVYMHCQAGCDRTGQAVIAWRLINVPVPELQDKNLLSTFFARNVQECGRPPNDFSVGGTEWFCEWLQLKHQANIGNCLHIADCKRYKGCTFPPVDPNADNDFGN